MAIIKTGADLFLGMDLSGRTLILALNNTTFPDVAVTAVRTLSGNTINQYRSGTTSIGSYTYNGVEHVFYSYDGSTTTKESPFTLPAGFGIISEIDTSNDNYFLAPVLSWSGTMRLGILSESRELVRMGELPRPLMLQAGDTWEFDNTICAGFLTGGGKAIWFGLPTPTIMADAVTIQNLRMQVRMSRGGYPTVSSEDSSVSILLGTDLPYVVTNGVNSGVLTSISANLRNTGIEFRAVFGNVTTPNGDLNNSPVGVNTRGTLVFS